MARMLLLLSLVLSSVAGESGAAPRPSANEREAEAHYLKALQCFEQNTLEYRRQGVRDLEEAVRLAPENMTYRLALANLRFVGGYYRAARQGYERVAAADSAAAYLNLGLLWRHDWLASKDPKCLDRAVDALMTAAWLAPSTTDAWLLLVPLYLEQHKRAEAASAAFSALESDPGRLEAHLAVAATLCHLGVVSVGDSIFRSTIPRLPPNLRAAFERSAPLPPDPGPTDPATLMAEKSSAAGGGNPQASAWTLRPEDEERLWSWSSLTKESLLLPASERNSGRLPAGLRPTSGSRGASRNGQGGRRFEWSRSGSGEEPVQGSPWENPELGIRMEVLGRLLASRPDLSDSRAKDGAAPPSVALAAMYARILAALGGAQQETSGPSTDARAAPAK
jgi:Tfp pilus assembly protein PilF